MNNNNNNNNPLWILNEELFIDYMPVFVIIMSIILFPVLLFVKTAPYGRYSNQAISKIQIDPRIAWFIMESINFLSVPVFFMKGNTSHINVYNIIIILPYWIHYIHRALIFPFLITSRQPMIWYVFAISYIWCFYNGFLFSRYFGYYSRIYTKEWLTQYNYIIGTILFGVGMFINIQSDTILRNLCKSGERQYKIPIGGLFNYITCPNYFGEILEWTGFGISSWTMSGISFAIFSFCNLVPRAITHHKWYKARFGKIYPSERKAIIPFVL